MTLSITTLQLSLSAITKRADDLQANIDGCEGSEIDLEEKLSQLARAEAELEEAISNHKG